MPTPLRGLQQIWCMVDHTPYTGADLCNFGCFSAQLSPSAICLHLSRSVLGSSQIGSQTFWFCYCNALMSFLAKSCPPSGAVCQRVDKRFEHCIEALEQLKSWAPTPTSQVGRSLLFISWMQFIKVHNPDVCTSSLCTPCKLHICKPAEPNLAMKNDKSSLLGKILYAGAAGHLHFISF